MRCEILYGPEAGTIKHYPNNDATAHNLIKSGLLRVVETEPGDMVRMGNGQIIPKMQPAPAPRWYIGTIEVQSACEGFAHVDVGKRVPTLVYEGLGQKVQWAGSPKDAQQHGFGKRVVPADILLEYAKAHAAYWKGRK